MCVCMSVIMCVVQGEMVKTPTVPPFNLPHTICQSFLLSNTEGIHITTHTRTYTHWSEANMTKVDSQKPHEGTLKSSMRS